MSGPAMWPHVADFCGVVPDVAISDDLLLLKASQSDWRSARNIAHTLEVYEGLTPHVANGGESQYAESGR